MALKKEKPVWGETFCPETPLYAYLPGIIPYGMRHTVQADDGVFYLEGDSYKNIFRRIPPTKLRATTKGDGTRLSSSIEMLIASVLRGYLAGQRRPTTRGRWLALIIGSSGAEICGGGGGVVRKRMPTWTDVANYGRQAGAGGQGSSQKSIFFATSLHLTSHSIINIIHNHLPFTFDLNFCPLA